MTDDPIGESAGPRRERRSRGAPSRRSWSPARWFPASGARRDWGPAPRLRRSCCSGPRQDSPGDLAFHWPVGPARRWLRGPPPLVAPLRAARYGHGPRLGQIHDRDDWNASRRRLTRIEGPVGDDAVDRACNLGVTQLRFGARRVALRGVQFPSATLRSNCFCASSYGFRACVRATLASSTSFAETAPSL